VFYPKVALSNNAIATFPTVFMMIFLSVRFHRYNSSSRFFVSGADYSNQATGSECQNNRAAHLAGKPVQIWQSAGNHV
jgi:hypothetical protein